MAGGYSAQPGHLLIRKQPTFGTIASDLTTAGKAIKLRSGSMGSNRTLMIPDPEIGGNRDVTDAYLGPVSWSGTFEFYARMDSFLSLLYAALGANSIDATGTPTIVHTLTPSDGAALPYMSMQEEIGAGLECFTYINTVVNTLHLECSADGYLIGQVGLIATKQTAGVTPTDVTALLDSLPMLVGTNITVTYNGASIPVKSFKFDLNNNFQDDDFRLGSFYLASLIPKRREITATMTCRDEDSSLFRQAVYGASGSTVAGGIVTKDPLVITMSTYETIAASSPPTAQSLQLTMPKVAFKPFSFSPSGDDVIENDIDMEALRPDPSTAVLTAVLTTDATAVY